MLLDKFFKGNEFVQMMSKAHCFEALLKTSYLMIAVKDGYGNHVYASEAHLRAFGFNNVEEMNDLGLTPGWPVEMRNAWMDTDKKVLDTRKPFAAFEEVTMLPKEPISETNPVLEYFSTKIPADNLLKTKSDLVVFVGTNTGEKLDVNK